MVDSIRIAIRNEPPAASLGLLNPSHQDPVQVEAALRVPVLVR